MTTAGSSDDHLPMSETRPRKPRRVLVVEDDAAIRQFIAEALADVGYEVVEAVDGSHALARLDVDPPDVVVLDLHMPVVDGPAFMAAIADRPTRPPVVLMSANGTASEVAAQLGAAAHIEKPFAVSTLISLVDRCAFSIAS